MPYRDILRDLNEREAPTVEVFTDRISNHKIVREAWMGFVMDDERFSDWSTGNSRLVLWDDWAKSKDLEEEMSAIAYVDYNLIPNSD